MKKTGKQGIKVADDVSNSLEIKKPVKKKKKKVIGRKDIIDLPDFGFVNIPAKIDTGAYTSALHCENIEVINEEGLIKISFYIPDYEGKLTQTSKFSTSQFVQKFIKSSTGYKELRYVITARIVIFGKEYNSEFSLTDRQGMKFPVLIGRKLLQKRFVVDVAKTNLSYKSKTAKTL